MENRFSLRLKPYNDENKLETLLVLDGNTYAHYDDFTIADFKRDIIPLISTNPEMLEYANAYLQLALKG